MNKDIFSYLNPVPINSYLKVRNCQIWQSGTVASEISGNGGVNFLATPGCDWLHLSEESVGFKDLPLAVFAPGENARRTFYQHSRPPSKIDFVIFRLIYKFT